MNQRPDGAWYDAIATDYAGYFADDESLAENRAAFDLLNYRGGSVLDIGCGAGLLLDYVKPDRYLGIDPSAGMLAELAKAHPDAETVLTTLEDFRTDRRFDLVCAMFGSISYVAPLAVERAAKFVAPGGRLFLMFFAVGYVPVTHIKSGIAVPYYPYYGAGREFRNFTIVEATHEALSARNGL